MAENLGEDIENAGEGAKKLNEELGYIEDTVISIADALSKSVKNAISDIKDESKSLNEIYEKNLTKSIKSIAQQSNDILKNQLKLYQGNLKSKDLEKQILDNEIKRLAIIRSRDNLIKNHTKLTQDQIDDIEISLSKIDEQNSLLKDQQEEYEEINKKLGVTGKVLDGVSKIPVLGNLIDAQTALKSAQLEAAKSTSTSTSVMSKALFSLGSSLKQNLSDPLVGLSLAFTVLQKMVKLAFKFDDRTVQISRNFGISYQNAARLNKEFLEISSNSSNALATAENYKEAYFNINNSLGTTAKLSKKQLEDQTQILKTTGLTAEEAATVAEYSILTGQSQEDVYDGVMAINTGVISNQKVLQETLSVSGELAANYRNNPQLIAQAVAQSQRLGLTLADTKDMSKSLLDFESSIAAEMEAELMTGKDLNLERARYFALMGKTDEAAKEMLKNVTLEEFQTTMNVKQRESLARAIGMSVDQLNNALVKQDKLSKLTKEQRIEAEALSKMQESGAEKLASAGEKLSNAFSSLFAGTGGELINKFADLVQSFASSGLGKALTGIGAAAALATGVIGLGRILKSLIIDGAMPVKIKGGTGGSVANDVMDSLDDGGGGGRSRGRGRGRGARGRMGRMAKGLSKVFGGKKTMVGKALRSVAARNLNAGSVSKIGDVAGDVAKTASKGGGFFSKMLGGIKEMNPFNKLKGIFKGPIAKIFGRLLGPIMTLAGGVMDISSVIGEAKENQSMGKQVDYSKVGSQILKSLAYPIANLALNAIPVAGTAMSIADGLLSMIGMSPIQFITDNLVDLLPSSASKALGEFAVGENAAPPKKMATGGIVTAETRAIVGEAGPEAVIPLDAFYKKIDELILAVRESGNISVDGIKLNNRVAMNAVKLGS